jgi:hypothetical protein
MPERILIKQHTSQIPSIGLCVCILPLLSVLGNGTANMFPCSHTKNACNNIIRVGHVIFYAVRVLSKRNLWVSVYPPIVARYQHGKDVPTAMKNCWSRSFLCGPCDNIGKWAISSSHNVLLLHSLFLETQSKRIKREASIFNTIRVYIYIPYIRFEYQMRWIFSLPNHSSRTMALVSTQPLTEMSYQEFSWRKKRPARRADNLAAVCERTV